MPAQDALQDLENPNNIEEGPGSPSAPKTRHATARRKTLANGTTPDIGARRDADSEVARIRALAEDLTAAADQLLPVEATPAPRPGEDTRPLRERLQDAWGGKSYYQVKPSSVCRLLWQVLSHHQVICVSPGGQVWLPDEACQPALPLGFRADTLRIPILSWPFSPLLGMLCHASSLDKSCGDGSLIFARPLVLPLRSPCNPSVRPPPQSPS